VDTAATPLMDSLQDVNMALHLWKSAADMGQKCANFMFLYVSGNDDVMKDAGFASFVMKNQGNLIRSKRGNNLGACLKLYAGVIRRRCLHG